MTKPPTPKFRIQIDCFSFPRWKVSIEISLEAYSALPALAFEHMLTLSSPAEEDEDGGDDLAPIDSSNIISGRRTRGKTIDFVDAAQKLKDDEGEDDEDDEDFEP